MSKEGFDVVNDVNAPDGFPNHLRPTWWNQLNAARQLLKEKGRHEVRRHAMVSFNNRHRCYECFCCACMTVLRER
jgi:hypothetical protein